jgi:transposase InsO family protein
VNKKRVLRILQERRGRMPKKAKHTNQRKFPNLIQQTLNDLLKNKHDPRHKEFKIKDGKSWKKNGKEFKPRKLLVATRPYQIWQCDWKEINISIVGIKCYLFLIIDTYTRQIKGFNLSLIKDAKSALKAMRSAIEKAKKDELFIPEKSIMHSDQGGAYLSNEYIAYLEHVRVQISMADRGKPTQNPYIEAFISLLVRFWLDHFEFLNYHELYKSINKFIYRYNTLWIHGEIGDITSDARLEQFRSSLISRR